VKAAVDEANADLMADVKAEISSSEQNILGAVSGVGTAIGHVTSDIQQVIGAETNAVQQITNSVVAGIKSILPFPL
jgi:hypothetical protein